MRNRNSSLKPILILIGILLVFLIIGGRSAESGSFLSSAVGSILKVMLWAAAVLAVLLVLFIILVILSVARDNSGKKKPATAAETQKKEEEKDVPVLTDEQKEILKKGNRNLLELRKKATDIQNGEIRKGSSEICELFEKTLSILRHKPGQITNARQCLNYYVPKFGEILKKYKSLESNQVLTDEINRKVTDYLVDIREALQKLNTKLFDNDKLDMSVEMEAMTIAFKRDGLLDDPDTTMDLKL